MSDEFVVRPGTILALEQSAAEFLVHRGGRITRAEAHAFAARSADAPMRRPVNVAVIPITGFIAPSIPSWLGTDPRETRHEVREARQNARVDAIVLLVDSPGGVVDGNEELAAEVRAARVTKPTVALIEGLAASAAYWITSAAGRIYAAPSSRVGSIGVFILHANIAGALAKEGVEITLVSSTTAPHKTEANAFSPLGEAARMTLQTEVDRVTADFLRDVARGRGVGVEQVRSGFGQGRVVDAGSAVGRGMVDEVATPEDALPKFLAETLGPRALADAFDDGRTLTSAQRNAIARLREMDAEDRERRAALLKLATL